MPFNDSEVIQLLVDTGRRCCICLTLYRVSVHHIVPLHEGGTDDVDNAIPLCPLCHEEVHTAYAPGRVTKSFTPQELKLHRQQRVNQVKSGVSPTGSSTGSISPEKIKAASELAGTAARLHNEIHSFIANNFEVTGNNEWRQLRQGLSGFLDAILITEWLLGHVVTSAANNVHDLLRETVDGISAGNSDRNHYNNHISVRGITTRNAAWTKFSEKSLDLRRQLNQALYAEVKA